MKHALLLRLLNVPLLAGLATCLVMIAMETATQQATPPSIERLAAVETPTDTEIERSDVTSSVDPVEMPILERSKDATGKLLADAPDDSAHLADSVDREPESDPLGSDVTDEAQPTPDQGAAVDRKEVTKASADDLMGAVYAGDQHTDDTTSTDDKISPTVSDQAVTVDDVGADDQMTREPESPHELSSARRRVADETSARTAAVSIESKIEREIESPIGVDRPTVSDVDSWTDRTPSDQLRITNPHQNRHNVTFLLDRQVRRLLPGQTTVINRSVTVRFDRGGSLGTTVEQLTLGQSYAFQVNSAQGWSLAPATETQ